MLLVYAWIHTHCVDSCLHFYSQRGIECTCRRTTLLRVSNLNIILRINRHGQPLVQTKRMAKTSKKKREISPPVNSRFSFLKFGPGKYYVALLWQIIFVFWQKNVVGACDGGPWCAGLRKLYCTLLTREVCPEQVLDLGSMISHHLLHTVLELCISTVLSRQSHQLFQLPNRSTTVWIW